MSGLTSLSGGGETGSGTTIAQGGAVIGAADSYSSFYLDGGRTLQLDGSSTASGYYAYLNLNYNPLTGSDAPDPDGGTLVIASGATFTDQTTSSGLQIVAPNYGAGDTGAVAAVDNQGTFAKTGTAATSTISVVFDNTGTVEVDAGTLSLADGGGSNAAAMTVAAGATLGFGSGTFAITGGGTVGRTGTVAVTGGTLDFGAQNATLPALALSGGELAGTGTVTVSGLTSLSGGGLEGGSATVQQGNLVAEGGLTISGGAVGIDGGWRVTAEGTTNWTDGYPYFGYNPLGTEVGGTNTFVNAAGASFDDQNSAGYYIDQYSGTGVFDNAGLFDKTAASGAGTTTVSTAFNNTGTVEVDAGTLSLSGGVNNTGKLWADGGNIDITGAVDGNGTDEITGAATLDFGPAVGAGQAVSCDSGSTGTLRLDKSQSFSGTIAGLALNGSNFLDLSDIGFGTATKATYSGTSTGGTLQVTDGTHTSDIALLGDYTASTFATETDNHGGTPVHDPARALALFVQAAASLAPGAGLGGTQALTPPLVATQPELVAHAV